MRILVTGSEGFLGSVLVPMLLQEPQVEWVFGVDAQFFGVNVSESGKYLRSLVRVENVNWATKLDHLKPDVVIALAALSNDPACELNPILTKKINTFSVVDLGYECFKRHITFLFPSSCSVYGAINHAAYEFSPTFPISLYAKEKLQAERDLWSMATDEWQPRILRMATLYGPSPRMRFDLAPNMMMKSAIHQGKITVSGGQQWRPFLHVQNAAKAFVQVALGNAMYGCIKNVGDFNAQVIDLAQVISDYQGASIKVNSEALDSRNYRLACLPDIKTLDCQSWLPALYERIKNISNPDDDIYYTVRTLKKVL